MISNVIMIVIMAFLPTSLLCEWMAFETALVVLGVKISCREP